MAVQSMKVLRLMSGIKGLTGNEGRRDELDVAVDLMGYTHGGRDGIFAHKPGTPHGSSVDCLRVSAYGLMRFGFGVGLMRLALDSAVGVGV